MKIRLFSFILAFIVVALFMTGCIHLPSLYSTPPGASHSAVSTATAAAAAAAHPATAKEAIQHAFNWLAGISVVVGLAVTAFGALAVYGGRIVSGVKLILAGAAIPVTGIWIAYHWGIVILGLVIAGAAYFIYQDRVEVAKFLKEIESKSPAIGSSLESEASVLLKKLEPTPGTAAAQSTGVTAANGAPTPAK